MSTLIACATTAVATLLTVWIVGQVRRARYDADRVDRDYRAACLEREAERRQARPVAVVWFVPESRETRVNSRGGVA